MDYTYNITEKRCTKCHELLTIDHFWFNAKEQRYASRCRSCNNKSKVEQYYKNYSKLQIQNQAYRDRHRDKHRAARRLAYRLDPQKYMESTKKSRRKLRLRIFNHYSADNPHCMCCGEKSLEFLCLDHKNNDGALHRKIFDLGSGSSIYYWIIKNDFPDMF